MRALIIEDEVIIALGLADDLEADGWATKLVPDGTEALQALTAQPFDLAIVDLRLPGESGSSLIDRMREIAPSMHLMVCTGYAADSLMVRNLPAGIRVVNKPCSSDDFMRAVQATMISNGPDEVGVRG